MPFEPSEYSGSDAPAPTVYKQESAKEAKLSAGLAKASAGVAATAAVSAAVAPPWSLIVTAAAAATSLGIQVASKVSGRNARALTGDEAAIAPFVKRAAKMKAAKRKQVAEKLLKALQKHSAHPKKTRPWKVKDNVLKMKLGALYAAQNHAHKNPHQALEPGAPTSAQVEAAADTGVMGLPDWVFWGLGVVGLGAAGLAVARR